MINYQLPLLLAASLLGASACAKKTPPPEAEATPKSQASAATPAAANADIPARVAKMIANFERVHFEFDAFTLSAETKAALEANVAIMNEHADVRVEIQGHADKRGTSEYNLALGEKRASALRDYMARLGVAKTRLETISFGAEKPAVEGDGETAWSKNRRGEFKVLWGADEAAGTTTD